MVLKIALLNLYELLTPTTTQVVSLFDDLCFCGGWILRAYMKEIIFVTNYASCSSIERKAYIITISLRSSEGWSCNESR